MSLRTEGTVTVQTHREGAWIPAHITSRQENLIARSAAAGYSPPDLAGSRRPHGITARTTRRI
ncbi:hypothetical protein [Methanosphaerula subterraneus]|uniref:hypothetical protein n=1 Tax=Methanosphaerula subterraneus TaxID=3350244 RepID=UPI003F86E0F8